MSNIWQMAKGKGFEVTTQVQNTSGVLKRSRDSSM
jgi:hypothetical protein